MKELSLAELDAVCGGMAVLVPAEKTTDFEQIQRNHVAVDPGRGDGRKPNLVQPPKM